MSSTKSLLPRSSSLASLKMASSMSYSVAWANMFRWVFLQWSYQLKKRHVRSLLLSIYSATYSFKPYSRHCLYSQGLKLALFVVFSYFLGMYKSENLRVLYLPTLLSISSASPTNSASCWQQSLIISFDRFSSCAAFSLISISSSISTCSSNKSSMNSSTRVEMWVEMILQEALESSGMMVGLQLRLGWAFRACQRCLVRSQSWCWRRALYWWFVQLWVGNSRRVAWRWSWWHLPRSLAGYQFFVRTFISFLNYFWFFTPFSWILRSSSSNQSLSFQISFIFISYSRALRSDSSLSLSISFFNLFISASSYFSNLMALLRMSFSFLTISSMPSTCFFFAYARILLYSSAS